jgi:hypothetical protein
MKHILLALLLSATPLLAQEVLFLLTWTVTDDTTEFEIEHVAAGMTNTTKVTLTNTLPITNVVYNATNYYRGRGINAEGAGPWTTNEVSRFVAAPEPPADLPTALVNFRIMEPGEFMMMMINEANNQ